jgi:thioredoxin-like negative regulator of GroEL
MTRLLAAILLMISSAEAADQVYVFSRPGCQPCEAMHKAFAKDPTLLVGLEVFKCDTAARPDIAKKYSVTSVPVVVLVRDGREVRRRVGWTTADDFRAWVDDKQFRRAWR